MVRLPQDHKVKTAYHVSLKECQKEYLLEVLLLQLLKKSKSKLEKNTKCLFAMLNTEKKPKERLPKKMKHNNKIITVKWGIKQQNNNICR